MKRSLLIASLTATTVLAVNADANMNVAASCLRADGTCDATKCACSAKPAKPKPNANNGRCNACQVNGAAQQLEAAQQVEEDLVMAQAAAQNVIKRNHFKLRASINQLPTSSSIPINPAVVQEIVSNIEQEISDVQQQLAGVLQTVNVQATRLGLPIVSLPGLNPIPSLPVDPTTLPGVSTALDAAAPVLSDVEQQAVVATVVNDLAPVLGVVSGVQQQLNGLQQDLTGVLSVLNKRSGGADQLNLVSQLAPLQDQVTQVQDTLETVTAALKDLPALPLAGSLPVDPTSVPVIGALPVDAASLPTVTDVTSLPTIASLPISTATVSQLVATLQDEVSGVGAQLNIILSTLV